MTTNLQWSIFWPTSIPKGLCDHTISSQLKHTSSQILISNTQLKAFYEGVIREKPELCQNVLLKVPLGNGIIDKKAGLKLQDKLCFLAEEFGCDSSRNMHFEFNTDSKPPNLHEFSQYLMEILVFFQERFQQKYQNISLFLNIPTMGLKEAVTFLKMGDKARPLGLAYAPYFYEKGGYDTLKTSFIWKPWVKSIWLKDVDFDGKTEVSPGEGLIPNKSACQIALENHKEITFMFCPENLNIKTIQEIEIYLKKCENFISLL